jgi:hypothetical protein
MKNHHSEENRFDLQNILFSVGNNNRTERQWKGREKESQKDEETDNCGEIFLVLITLSIGRSLSALRINRIHQTLVFHSFRNRRNYLVINGVMTCHAGRTRESPFVSFHQGVCIGKSTALSDRNRRPLRRFDVDPNEAMIGGIGKLVKESIFTLCWPENARIIHLESFRT